MDEKNFHFHFQVDEDRRMEKESKFDATIFIHRYDKGVGVYSRDELNEF